MCFDRGTRQFLQVRSNPLQNKPSIAIQEATQTVNHKIGGGPEPQKDRTQQDLRPSRNRPIGPGLNIPGQ